MPGQFPDAAPGEFPDAQQEQQSATVPALMGPLTVIAKCTTYKSGNTLPALHVVLYDAGVAVNLGTPDSITFAMRAANGSQVLATGEATTDEGTAGGVIYQWGADDLSTDGPMVAEITCRWGEAIATFPDTSYLQITVLPAIA